MNEYLNIKKTDELINKINQPTEKKKKTPQHIKYKENTINQARTSQERKVKREEEKKR